MEGERIPLRKGLMGISPMVVFLLFYVVTSLVCGDFYRMPIAVALLVASAWGIAMQRGESLSARIERFSRDAGNPDILYMIWIFVLAGAFAALAKSIGAVEATVNLALHYLPPQMIEPGLFFAACFISLAIGTSVGTVVALVPLAVEIAGGEGASVAFFVAIVMGGAFFGDNLSFISDTTIAATRTQNCRMNEKFKANLLIVVPAAVGALALYSFLGADLPEMTFDTPGDFWLVVPYISIIVLAVAGVNVTIVLGTGILTALVIAMVRGYGFMDLLGFMGSGIESVGNLVIVTLLAGGMLGIIAHTGGIRFIMQVLNSRIRGRRGALAGIAVLVGVVNLCTANNTIAILTVGPLAKDIADRYGISGRRTASVLDTCSCIVQSLIPYGAQALLAASLSGLPVLAPLRYMYYPWLLAATVSLYLLFSPKTPAHKDLTDGDAD